VTVVKTKGMLSSTESEELGALQPPVLIYKQITVSSSSSTSQNISVEVKVIDVTIPTGVNIIHPYHIQGGLLLCVTSERQSSSTVTGTRSAAAAQGLSAVTAVLQSKSSSSTTAADKNIQKISSSTATVITSTLQQVQKNTDESTGSGSKYNQPLLKSQFYTLIPVNESQYRLEPVGSAMPPVTSISWDFESGYAAVLTGSRTSIIKLSVSVSTTNVVGTTTTSATSATTAQLRSIATVDLADSVSAATTSLYWSRGCLFVSTPSQVSLVATDYPFCHNRSRSSSIGGSNSNSDNLVAESAVEVFSLSNRLQVLLLFVIYFSAYFYDYRYLSFCLLDIVT